MLNHCLSFLYIELESYHPGSENQPILFLNSKPMVTIATSWTCRRKWKRRVKISRESKLHWHSCMSFNQKNNKGAKNFALCLSDCLFPNWSSVSFLYVECCYICVCLFWTLSIYLFDALLGFFFSKSWILNKSPCVATTSSPLHFKLICEKRSATAEQRDLVRTQAPKQRNLSKVYINLIVLFRLSGRYLPPVLHLYSPLSWWLTETKRSKACEEMSPNGNDSTPRSCTRLRYVNHWWTQKNHFSGNTSTRWLFVDHVPRIKLI